MIMTTIMLLLNLMLLGHYTGAVESSKQPLRSYNDAVEASEKDTFMLDHRGSRGRDIQWVYTPPPNDACENATIIPSSFPGATFITGISEMRHAGPDTLKINCGYWNNFGNVWYKFTPLHSDTYDFINSQYSNFGVFLAVGFGMNATCGNMTQIKCSFNKVRLNDVQLIANQTYYIQVETQNKDWGTVTLTVLRHIPPSNNQCTNATAINPTVPTVVHGDNTFAVPIDNTGLLCGTNGFQGSHWYKINNPSTTPISINVTGIQSSISISVFKGNNCGALLCIQNGFFSDYSLNFAADGLTSHYILVQKYDHPTDVKFTLTIDSTARFFSVIDPITDNSLFRLTDISYSWGYNGGNPTIGGLTSKLNLQANFGLPNDSIKSVRMTFDNPKRNVCERQAPYSVFGDSNGDYKNATIAIGRRTVTATPFTESNCTGRVGQTMTQSFNVSGCSQSYNIFRNTNFNHILLTGSTVRPIVALPCRVNIAFYPTCKFPIETVRIELRNGTTNGLILSATRVAPIFYGSYFYLLFDRIPKGTYDHDFLTGSLKAGSYSVTSIINNVTHPSFNFTVWNTTCRV